MVKNAKFSSHNVFKWSKIVNAFLISAVKCYLCKQNQTIIYEKSITTVFAFCRSRHG